MVGVSALEKEIVNALVAKGRSENEALTIINKVKKSASVKFAGAADMEISDDGKYLAIANCTALSLSKSGKALLIEVGGVEMWMPVTQIATDLSEVIDEGDIGILVINRWIAEQKGLIVNGVVQAPKPNTATP